MKNKVIKTQKYFTIFHAMGVVIKFRDSRRNSNEDFVMGGDRGGVFLHIKVQGNEDFVNELKLELTKVNELFESKNSNRFSELKRVVNSVYYKFLGKENYYKNQ